MSVKSNLIAVANDCNSDRQLVAISLMVCWYFLVGVGLVALIVYFPLVGWPVLVFDLVRLYRWTTRGVRR